MEKIEIDWDIHQLIERERRGFDEPPFTALRRLLKLPEPIASAPSQPKPDAHGSGTPWTEDGVSVPHGSAARMEYDRGRQVYEGQFLERAPRGEWTIFQDALCGGKHDCRYQRWFKDEFERLELLARKVSRRDEVAPSR